MLSADDHKRAIRENPERLLSRGRHFAEGRLAILDDEGQEVKPGTIGEITIQGPDGR